MRSIELGKRRHFCTSVALLMAAFTMLRTEPVAAQYIYQPAPDYYHNDTASGTILGGAMGAITGAIIGGKKHGGQDALIGAGVGAVTGNLLGRSKDAQDDRRGRRGGHRWPAQPAGRGDGRHQLRSTANDAGRRERRRDHQHDALRGARIDLSPQSLIALKQQGISDRVVMAAQDMTAGRGYAAPAPAAVGVVAEFPPPPTAVIVEPGWRPYHYYHPRPYYHHHHPHTYVRVGF